MFGECYQSIESFLHVTLRQDVFLVLTGLLDAGEKVSTDLGTVRGNDVSHIHGEEF